MSDISYTTDLEDLAEAIEIDSRVEAGLEKTYTLEEVARELGIDITSKPSTN